MIDRACRCGSPAEEHRRPAIRKGGKNAGKVFRRILPCRNLIGDMDAMESSADPASAVVIQDFAPLGGAVRRSCAGAVRVARALATVLFLLLPAAAAAQERYALVVGIDEYGQLPSLERAVNDAQAMADTLERAGFNVDAGFNLDRRGFSRLLSQFVSRLAPGDEALFFYAGHAVAIDNGNYLVPGDASAVDQSNETRIISESIGQNFILEQLTETGVRLSVVIMDACRNNPFEGITSRNVGRARGLAIEQPPQGVFMMFSADEGQEALDGLGPDDDHPNSLFTRTLIPLLEEPGLDIVDVARRLRGEVEALAASVGRQQFPVYRDRMRGDGRFYVRGSVDVSGTDPCLEASDAWQTLRQSDDTAALSAFIESQRGCPTQRALARARLQTLLGKGAATSDLGSVAVTPRRASVGDELNVVTQTPAGCAPFFFNLTADDRFTRLPTELFARSVHYDGREHYVIDADNRYGLVITEEDTPGLSTLGFLCEPTGFEQNDVRDLMRRLRAELDGAGRGRIAVSGREVIYNSTTYEVLRD